MKYSNGLPWLAEALAHPEPPEEPKAVSVRVAGDKFFLQLEDGRELGVPIQWCPLLRGANRRALKNVVLVNDGEALHWPDRDEDLRVTDLLYPPRFAKEFK
jgi:hypothetical protein